MAGQHFHQGIALAFSGFIQAHLKFCANYGWRGIRNLGDIGDGQRVDDAASRAVDRRRAQKILGASALGRAVASDYWSFLIAVMLFGVGGPIISSGSPKVVAEEENLPATTKALKTLKDSTGLMPDQVSTNMERKRTGEIRAHAVVIRLSI